MTWDPTIWEKAKKMRLRTRVWAQAPKPSSFAEKLFTVSKTSTYGMLIPKIFSSEISAIIEISINSALHTIIEYQIFCVISPIVETNLVQNSKKRFKMSFTQVWEHLYHIILHWYTESRTREELWYIWNCWDSRVSSWTHLEENAHRARVFRNLGRWKFLPWSASCVFYCSNG